MRKYRDYQIDIQESDKKKISFPIFGLVNPAKSYNGFLNSIIQSFWYIDSLRNFFVWYSMLYSYDDSEFIKELKGFFGEIISTPKNEFDNKHQFYYLKDLRDELQKLPGCEGLFGQGEMGDATELYDTILTKVQENLTKAPDGTLSSCGSILQDIIGLNVNRTFYCPCGKKFDLDSRTDQYVSLLPARSFIDTLKIDRKMETSKILMLLQSHNQKLGQEIREYFADSVAFRNEDHKKECNLTK